MIVARLSCEHRIRIPQFTDKVRLEEMCPKCHAVHLVMDYTRDKWHSRCHSCRYSRTHGQSEALAEAAANDHAKAKPGHSAYTAYYNEYDGAASVDDMMVRVPTLFDTLPDDAPPPF